jgi:hypothetical protein
MTYAELQDKLPVQGLKHRIWRQFADDPLRGKG